MTFPYTGLIHDICMKYHIPALFPYALISMKSQHFWYMSWYRIGKHRANFLYLVDEENFKFQVTFPFSWNRISGDNFLMPTISDSCNISWSCNFKSPDTNISILFKLKFEQQCYITSHIYIKFPDLPVIK